MAEPRAKGNACIVYLRPMLKGSRLLLTRYTGQACRYRRLFLLPGFGGSYWWERQVTPLNLASKVVGPRRRSSQGNHRRMRRGVKCYPTLRATGSKVQKLSITLAPHAMQHCAGVAAMAEETAPCSCNRLPSVHSRARILLRR